MQADRVNSTKEAWCQANDEKPMEETEQIVAAETTKKEAGTVDESVPTPPSGPTVKFTTEKPIVNYFAEVSEKHLLTL